MSLPHYPAIADKETIKVIAGLYALDAEYFTNPACPYDQAIKEIFMGSGKHLDFDSHSNVNVILTDEDVITEINDLHQKLKGYWDEVEKSEKSADKNTFFRVNVSLLERIVDLRERMTNTLKINAFIAEVLSIMDEIMTADQKNEIMARMAQFQTGDKKCS